MKKLFALFALVMFSASVAYADEPSFETTMIKRQAGSRQAAPVRVIKLVRFVAQGPDVASVLSGDVVVYSTVSDDGVSIDRTTVSADGAVAGIACTTIRTSDSTGSASAQDDAGRRNWGWIVVHGPMTAKVSAGGTNGHAAGDMWITSTDSGAITGVVNSTVTTGASTNEVVKIARGKGGFFFSAANASSTTAEVFVSLE